MGQNLATLKSAVPMSQWIDSDYHIHTLLCGHAAPDMIVLNILKRAEIVGLRRIAITEHVHEPAHLERINRIRQEIIRYQGPLEVVLGIEIDADSKREDGSLVASTDDVDYVVAATHHYPGGKHWWFEKLTMSDSQRRNIYRRWFDWIKRIAENQRVHTISHPGVFLAQNDLTNAFEGRVLKDFADLFRCLARHGKAVELNELAGTKLSVKHRQTYPRLIQMAVEAGVPIVIGSDAHRLEAIGRFPWCQAVAQQAGLEPAHLWHPIQ